MRTEDDLCRRVDRGVLSPRDVTAAGWGIIVGRRLGGAVFDAARRPINDRLAGSPVPQRGCKGTLGCHTAALQVLESYFQRHVGSVSRLLAPQFFFIGQHRTCPSRPGAGIQVSRVAGGVDRYCACQLPRTAAGNFPRQTWVQNTRLCGRIGRQRRCGTTLCG